jgi:hypothetical protein
MTWSASYSPEDIHTIEAWTESLKSRTPNSSLTTLFDAAKRHIKKRTQQDIYIQRITEKIPIPLMEIPFYFSNNLVLSDVDRMSLAFFNASSLGEA